MSEEYYPPPAFYFNLTVIGSATALFAMTLIDASCQEVTGIQAEFDVETVVEGGENRFVHRLPRYTKYPNLVLKRGIVTKTSFLAEWFSATIGSGMSLPIIPQNLLLTLLNAEGLPIVAWGFVNAFPIRWEIAPMDSQDNKILFETLELSYNYFERINLGSGPGTALKLAQFAARLT